MTITQPSQDASLKPHLTPVAGPIPATSACWRFAAVLVGAALYTFMLIQYSFQHSHLTSNILYDDIVYLVEGSRQLRNLMHGGLFGLLKQYLIHPPHSPWSTYLAMLSFWVFGLHDWAPYAGNCALIIITLCFVLRLMAGTPKLFQAAALAFLLSSRLLVNAVLEFRPDFASALFTAMGIVILLQAATKELRENQRGQIIAGLCFALSLWAKTSTFPVTVILLALTLTLHLVVAIGSHTMAPSPRSILAVTARVVLTCLVIALPHYILNRYEIYDYIWKNMFGRNAELWRAKSDLVYRFRYFLTGDAGTVMLGRHLWFALPLAAGGLIASHLLARKHALFAWALLAMTGLSYTFASLNTMQNPFFGLTFQLLLLLFGIITLTPALHALPAPWPKRAAMATASTVFLIAVAVECPARSPWYKPTGSDLLGRSYDALNQELWTTIYDDIGSDPGPKRFFYTTEGNVNYCLSEWLHARSHESVYDFGALPWNGAEPKDPHYADDFKLYQQEMAKRDYIIANDHGVAGEQPTFSAVFSDVSLQILFNDSRYKLLKTIDAPLSSGLPPASSTAEKGPHARHYYLFKNTRVDGR